MNEQQTYDHQKEVLKMNERPNLKQIRIKKSVCAMLDERKGKDDSYTDVIQALLDENARLQERNVELKQDKEMLMKIALKTQDAIAFPNIAHYVYFALIEVLKDKELAPVDAVNYLKTYLRPSLDVNPKEVLKYVNEFSDEYEEHKDLLLNVVMWIEKTYNLE